MYINPLKKYRYVITAVVLSLIIIFSIIYYSPYGAKNYFEIQSELNKISSEVDGLKEQNKQLKTEIANLKSDNEYVEEVARKQFGLLKKNEMVFEFSSKNNKR